MNIRHYDILDFAKHVKDHDDHGPVTLDYTDDPAGAKIVLDLAEGGYISVTTRHVKDGEEELLCEITDKGVELLEKEGYEEIEKHKALKAIADLDA
jgi:hypothetical protein